MLNDAYDFCVSIKGPNNPMIFFTDNNILEANGLFYFVDQISMEVINNKLCDVDICVSNTNIEFVNNCFDNVKFPRTYLDSSSDRIDFIKYARKQSSNIKFIGNHFDNTRLKYDDYINIIVDDTNTFTNCDGKLITQLIEDTLQFDQKKLI